MVEEKRTVEETLQWVSSELRKMKDDRKVFHIRLATAYINENWEYIKSNCPDLLASILNSI